MKSGAVTLGHVFAQDQQNVIPLFQRPYVWDAGKNWQPLWEDVRLAAEEVESDASQHGIHRTYFLGAVVLQFRPKLPMEMVRWNIVDGQQRLTTLQVLIGAARRIAEECGYSALASSFGTLVENKREAIHPDYPDDLYKVWPLPQDRRAFLWAVSTEPSLPQELDSQHRLVLARAWFDEAIREWAKESENPEHRLYYLLETLKNRMELVQITLEANDDPQVIFEVLNHRGVPLDAVDLVKNLLFQQLEHAGQLKKAEGLLQEVWLPLDTKPWRQEITRGRTRRTRADILLSYWLTIENESEVSVEHLFSEFKARLLSGNHYPEDVIRSIRRHADCMDAMDALPMTDPTAQLLDRMDAAQTSTPWPVLLHLFEHPAIPQTQRDLAAQAIDSFLLRRSVCRMTTKDYNHLFIQVLKEVKRGQPEDAGNAVVRALLAQDSESRLWPTDQQFDEAMQATNLFHVLTRARLRSFLLGINAAMHTSWTDPAPLLSHAAYGLTVEHLLPQKWEDHWPLKAKQKDPDFEVVYDRRVHAVHSLGNLTLLTSGFNAAQRNYGWAKKKKELLKQALLPLTTKSVLSAPDGVTELDDAAWSAAWDEERIDARGRWLRDIALKVWSRPTETVK